MGLSKWVSKSDVSGKLATNNVVVKDGSDICSIVLDVVDVDFNNPNLSVTATVEISPDGVEWVPQMIVNWMGKNSPIGKSGKWYAAVNGFSKLAKMQVRVRLDVPNTVKMGILGEIA